MHRLTALLFGTAALAFAMPAAAAQESVIYSFQPAADGNPNARLLLQKNTLFGTTAGDGGSLGTVFALKGSGSAWKDSTLVAFDGSNGAYPQTGLIADSNGNLYGTTSSSGTYNGGTLFELTKANGIWTLQTLWYFGNTADGVSPIGDLLMDQSGAIYGTTEHGGAHNLGTVFKLTQSGGVWTESVLYSFAGGTDGELPEAGLVMDKAGALYGTTYYGGDSSTCNGGCGTAFKLTQSGGVWTDSVLHAFGNGTDGRFPSFGPLVLASGGALYGTTVYGGTNDWGVVFELTQAGGKWKEKIVHAFGGAQDGEGPAATLVEGASGTLYGTTVLGGANGGGTVYVLTKSNGGWTESVVTNFPNSTGDGFFPHANVAFDQKSGTLYGTTVQGGSGGFGTVYQIVAP